MTRIIIMDEGLVGQHEVFFEGVVLDLGQSRLGLGREGQARFVADLALRREGAADDGLDLAVGGTL